MDYVEKNDNEFTLQLNNFKNKLPNYMMLFGIDQPTVDSVTADAAYMSFLIPAITPAKDYTKGWVEQKDNARKGTGTLPITGFPTPVDVVAAPAGVAPGIEKRFRNLAQQIKSNPNYTVTIGQDLGIVASGSDPEITAPILKLSLKGGAPNIGYKRGTTEGVRIYSKRADETSFTFLDVSTRSPYVDTRPNVVPNVAETRQYYAFYIVDDEQVGNQSATVSISMA